MKDYKYCPICGSSLEKKLADGRERLVCGTCGKICYWNPLPAAACLVANSKGSLLLVKRAVAPRKGEWCLPGGFIEMDETLPEAALRELLEETGLCGCAEQFIGAYIQKSDMYGAVLVVGVEIAAGDAEPIPGDDASEAKFFPQTDMPEIPFESHTKLIKKYFEMSK
jgi:8-oxo-dGTP diphosphatase